MEQAKKQAKAVEQALQAAEAEMARWNVIVERMHEWMKYPEVLTPFPWAGKEYIIPCNHNDLEYYQVCPRGYPPGVREWEVRWEAHEDALDVAAGFTSRYACGV